MKVYVVLREDRHSDADAHVYYDQDRAIARARSIADDFAHHPTDVREIVPPPPGWLYFVYYSAEDDSVLVYETEIL